MNIPYPQIAQVVGAPIADVTSTVGALASAFQERGILSSNVLIASIATVKVECPPFRPIHEYGTDAYFTKHYGISENPHLALELGNAEAGDGIRYAGRGLAQLTGRSNYRKYGHLLGVDLEANPDLALRPDIAGRIFVLFFIDHGCVALANVQDWTAIRRKWNGGLNGLALFHSIIVHLTPLFAVSSGT
jgi:hypothetical protein